MLKGGRAWSTPSPPGFYGPDISNITYNIIYNIYIHTYIHTYIYIYYIYTHTYTYIYIHIWGYMSVCFLFKAVCLWGSPRKIFILFPAGFVISPVRNLLLGLTPEKFLKFEIFPGESSSPHQGTETGCFKRGLNWLGWHLIEIVTSYCLKQNDQSSC